MILNESAKIDQITEILLKRSFLKKKLQITYKTTSQYFFNYFFHQ